MNSVVSPPDTRLPASQRSPQLWATGIIFVCFVLSFVSYVMSEAALDHAHEIHDRATHVADELRHGTDELTRMARTYVITGNPVYREHFMVIRDMQAGKRPYPSNYGNIFWDLVLAGEREPEWEPGQTAMSSRDRRSGFTASELRLLESTRQQAEVLNEIEFRAIRLFDSTEGQPAENRRLAISMLHDQAFHQAKAQVMAPIDEFYRKVAARTEAEIDRAGKSALALQLIFLSLGAVLVVMLHRARKKLVNLLGGRVEDLYERIAALGKGELHTPIHVLPGKRNTVMGWLEQARQQLQASEDRHGQAVARLNEAQRLARVGSWELDLAQNQLVWSDEIYRIFEIDPSEFGASYEAFLSIVHPDDQSAVNAAYQRSLDTRQPYTISHRLLMPDGRIKYVVEHAETRYSADGNPLVSMGTVQDVTDKHVLQEALSALATTLAPLSGKEFYQAVTRLLHDLLGLDQVFLARVDPVLARCEVIAGWAGGAPMQEFFYSVLSTPCLLVVQHGHQCFASGVQDAFPGDPMLVQMGVQGYVGRAIYDKQQTTRGLLVGLSQRAMTQVELVEQMFSMMVDRLSAEMQRADAEQELRTSEARIRGLGDNLPDGFIYQLSKIGQEVPRFIYVSSGVSRVIGVSPEEVLHNSARLYDRVDPAMIAEFIALEAESRRKMEDFETEFRISAEGGKDKWISVRSRPRALDNGQIVWDGVALDVTEQRQAEDRLRLSASVFENANEGIMITDPFGNILDVNEAFSAITGYEKAAAVGKNARILNSGRQDRHFYEAMWSQLNDKGHWRGELWNRRKDGNLYAEMLTIGAVRGKHQQITHFVALFHDITALKNHQKELEFIAHFDALTHLPNRVLLADRLQQAMTQSHRHHQRIAVAYIDLDGFKSINDRYSHAIGDKLLMQVASKLRHSLRDGDTLSRLGGDEFVAVLLDLDSPEAAFPVLERLLAGSSEIHDCDGLELRVSASIGVSFYPQADESVDADQLLRQADQAMYVAKQAGKNRYCVFDAEHDRSVRSHHEGLERIRQALQNKEFVLHYQPKVNMRSGQILGVEALIRWQHPERGLLPPGAFLPLIDNHTLSIELGEWVIENALGQVVRWRAEGLALPVSVNIDALQLGQGNFIEKLRAQLQQFPQYQAGDLELEVLETIALADMSHISDVIASCQELGVRFALDDFGTGYSSLTYLKRLPAQVLKIDQSFVRDMLDDPDDVAILDGVLGLAVAFQRQAIAEGVETAAHSEMLLQMGCELGQGYAIARPMPAEAIPAWVRGWRPDACWKILRQIERDDLPVLAAMAEYRACTNLLRQQLEAQGTTVVLQAARLARLGQWLDTPMARRHAGHPVFARIVALHDSFMSTVDEALRLGASGLNTDALALQARVETVRDELLGLFQQLVSGA